MLYGTTELKEVQSKITTTALLMVCGYEGALICAPHTLALIAPRSI